MTRLIDMNPSFNDSSKGTPSHCDTTPLNGIRVLAALNGLELFGHERENLQVLESLASMGAEVLLGVNALDDGGDVGRKARQDGVEVFQLPFGNQWSWQWLRQYPLSVFEKANQVIRCSSRFRQAIRDFKPTHIHLGSPLAYSFLAPALWIWNGPLIYRIGDYPPVDSWFNLPIWRSAMKRATRIIPISDFITRSIGEVGRGAFERKIIRIYGTQPSLEMCLPGDPFTIGFVGRLTENKGVFLLLETFGTLVESIPTATLEFVGSGPAEELLKRKVMEMRLDDRVRFHGYLQNPREAMRNWSFQVVPSIWNEALGMVVLEAKALGKPVIVFPRGGLPEMVRHRVDGYVCRDSTTEALLEALQWMIAQGAKLSTMGIEARSDIKTRFGEDGFREQWASVYLQSRSAVND